MAADENYRLSDSLLPNFSLREFSDLREAITRLIDYLRVLNQALSDRDAQIKQKVNQLHVEYVTTTPSDAPDEPEPVLRILFDDPDYYLYVYVNSTWKKVALT
jgi:23S rRNA-/tRNA-specific pseudouridylate synthase